MTEHDWALENLGDYATGLMLADEAERLARHLKQCAECSRTLADWQRMDDRLGQLFAGDGPKPAMQDRVIGRLRKTNPPRRPSPWLRVAVGLAAMVFIGALGAGMQHLAGQDRLAAPGNGMLARLFAAEEAKQRDTSTVVDYSGSMNNEYEFSELEGMSNSKDKNKDREEAEVKKDAPYLGWRGLRADVEGKLNGGPLEMSVKIQDQLPEKPPARVGKIYILGNDVTFGRKKREESLRLPELKIAEANLGRSDLFLFEDTKRWVAPSASTPPPIAKPARIVWNDETAKPQHDDTTRKAGEALALGLSDSKSRKGGAQVLELGETDHSLSRSGGLPGATGPAMAQPVKGADDGRKIVRTGEMEFEVSKFDDAVARIKKLIGDIKGAHVADTSSTTGENGKTRGSVVVRMPPEHLNNFVIDLKKALADMGGEKKGERIRTNEVTKQYTDIESRLKAALILEERYLKIIKSDKGEVKDLIAAEKELGKTREAIEQMKGEIRYYDNQVALSTLTITLTEKEIQAAAGLVRNEKVAMSVAVDDVDKAADLVLIRAMALNGRVIKTGLKELPDGQRGAQITLEVPHEHRDDMINFLKLRGDVTAQDSSTWQTTEGGTRPTAKLKETFSDVQFIVELSNFIGIKPRETRNLRIASRDVAAEYKKLRDLVEKVAGKGTGGQIRVAQLKEQDLISTTASFDFDLPATDLAKMTEYLDKIGDVVSRSTTQVPPGEVATRRKVGFNLTLVHFATEAPREMAVLTIDVRDMADALAILRGMVKDNHGIIIVEKGPIVGDKGKVSGNFSAIIPLAAKNELVSRVEKLGFLKNQQFSSNPQSREAPLAVVGLAVNLTSAGPIVPSDEGIWTETRTSLYYAFKVLSMSLMFIIVGLSALLPLTLVLFVIVKVTRKFLGRSNAA